MYIKKLLPQLSWSKVSLFLQCPRCFYKNQVLKKKYPGSDPDRFLLNNAVDTLWKNEFDQYREQQIAHPTMIKHKIKAIPFAHDSLAVWRDYRAGGIRVTDHTHDIELYGVIDDLWINPQQELIIVDYKATAMRGLITLNDSNKWNISNKRQMSFYAFLLKKLGYPVHSTGYFVYGIADTNKPAFNERLDFNTRILAYALDDSWIEPTMQDLRSCLKQKVVPEPGKNCDFCNFDLTVC